MAGVKGRSGGARPGAGRKRTPPAPVEPAVTGYDDPLVFLRAVWRGEVDASPAQVRAATAALPFLHRKLGEGGKKDQRQQEAEAVAGRFSGLRRVK